MPRDVLPDGGWRMTERGWELDPSQVERVRKLTAKALKRIAKAQRSAPACRLCGQRCRALDRAGLCSKVTADHLAARRSRRG